jgi:hypothetical protein
MWSSTQVHLAVLVAVVGTLSGCSDTDVTADFVEIGAVAEMSNPDVRWPGSSTGSFTVDCGLNERGHRNADNFITKPGEVGAAHHVHDYVGNVSTDAMSTELTLASAETTCVNGDKSTYFWPVLRLRGQDHEHSAEIGNTGTIVLPAFVDISYTGNPATKVLAMPRFLRVITGDPKALTSTNALGVARWSCSGHARQVTSAYPLCADDELVLRIYDFPSCWDGRNVDSENHRAHMAFPNTNGECPRTTYPVPHLVMTVSYDVPPGPSYQIDAFPDQRNSPTTDHADFANLMTTDQMAEVVDCLNRGVLCRPPG